MIEKKFFKRSLYFTGLVTIGIWLLLIWNHFHGGVPSHHIMHQKDLPAISNWWGGLLLPLLTLFLTFRIQNKLVNSKDNNSDTIIILMKYIWRFLCALSFGIILSIFFTLGYSNLSGYMVYGLFLMALFFPIYSAECYLGFVIGMTFTFGVILPAGVGAIFALIGILLYLYVRIGIIFIVKKIFLLVSPNNRNINK